MKWENFWRQLLWDGPFKRRKSWSDGAKTRTEMQLDSFIASVENALSRLRASRLDREKQEAFGNHLQKRNTERKLAAEHTKATAKEYGARWSHGN